MTAKKPVLAFLHSAPDEIPAGRSELEPGSRQRLVAFRAKVEGKHHCKYWSNAEDLGGKVSRAMSAALKLSPALGWVRADQAKTIADVERTSALQQRVSELEKELERYRRAAVDDTSMFEQGDDTTVVTLSWSDENNVEHSAQLTLTWDELFRLAATIALNNWAEDSVEYGLSRLLSPRVSEALTRTGPRVRMDGECFERMRNQFLALKLIEIHHAERLDSNGIRYVDIRWDLTERGSAALARLVAKRRSPAALNPGAQLP